MTMPIPDGSVVITPAQMYAEIQATRQAVDRLTSTVDPAMTEVRNVQHDHETTIRGLVRDTTVMKTQLRAAWAGLGLLLIALGVVAAFVANAH